MYKVTIEEVVPPVEGGTTYNREKTLYTQYVETLDVKKVIAVVNELPVIEPPRSVLDYASIIRDGASS